MKEKYLIVVDMQNDFVTGALGTDEAKAIVQNVVSKIKSFDGEIIYTMDTHSEDYLNTAEGKMLAIKHCIKGTDGWKLVEEIELLQKEKTSHVFEKNTFGSVKLAEYLLKKYNENEIERIEMVGLCTDICVISNALLIKAFIPEVKIIADSSCMAGVTKEKHKCAIETIKSCQIIVEEE